MSTFYDVDCNESNSIEYIYREGFNIIKYYIKSIIIKGVHSSLNHLYTKVFTNRQKIIKIIIIKMEIFASIIF